MKKLIAVLCTFLCLSSVTTLINAEELPKSEIQGEVIQYEHIPSKMQPYSKIKFIDDNHYVILNGGLVPDEKNYSRNGVPKPKKGMTVIYSSDGFIHDIELDSTLNKYAVYSDVEKDSIKLSLSTLNTEIYEITPFVEAYDGYVKIANWGAHNNRLYMSEGETPHMIGLGRATTFNDKMGDNNNFLKKGDVALKGTYDNCDFNSIVNVKAQKKNGGTLTVSMTRADHGGMPDAIVDIWKTGVEHWGYTYSSYLSLPGKTTIEYQGNSNKFK